MTPRFEEATAPSTLHPSGTWLVTRCYLDDTLSGIDLGWREPDINYRQIGIFKHEAEALHAIGIIEAGLPAPSITDILNAGEFLRHSPSGFSTGSDQWFRQLSEDSSVWLEFDIDGTRLFTVTTAPTYVREDVATLHLYTDGTMLAGIAGSIPFAAGLLYAILYVRIAAGDAMTPLKNESDI